MGPRRHHTGLGFEEAPELLRARRVPELTQRLGLDLSDALAGDREVLPDLLQGVLAAVGEAEAEPQDLLLARGERVEDLVRLLAEREADDRLDWRHDLLVLYKIAQMAVFFLSDRRFERNRLLRDFQYFAHLVHGDVHLRRDLLRGGLAAELLHELPRGPDELVDRLDHVHGDPDRARLVGDGARDRLPDPPGRVGRELVTAAVLELVHRLHEADVALLDEVEELEPPVRVFLGDRDDEAEVRLHHLLLRLGRLLLPGTDHLDDALQLIDPGLRVLLDPLDLPLRVALPPLARRKLPVGGGVEEVGIVRVVERGEESLELLRPPRVRIAPELDLPLGLPDLEHHALEPRGEALDDARVEPHLAQHGDDSFLLRAQSEVDLLAPGVARPVLLLVLEERVQLPEEPIEDGEVPRHLADELRLLLLDELLVGGVDDVADGQPFLPEPITERLELAPGERRAHDRPRDSLLPLLDPLGQGDLSLAGEEGDPAHLPEVHAHRVLGAADGTGGEVDGVAVFALGLL